MCNEKNGISATELDKIKKSINSFLVSTDQLASKISQFSKQDAKLDGVVDLLTQAEHYIQSPPVTKQVGFLAARQNIPFREIFSLLKDGYNGKMNDHLQEILDSAEIELTVKNRDPDNPQSPKELEIKIELAAAVIDKYAGLLSMVIGKKSTDKKEKEIIEKASKAIDVSTKKFRRINLMYGISQVEQEISHYIREHKASHCLPFLCTGKTIQKYQSLAKSLRNLLSDPLSAHELAGGLYTIRTATKAISDPSIRNEICKAINQVLTINGYPVEDKKAEKFIEIYTTRMDTLKKHQLA
ncbi:hypothetical protein E3983_07320 [Legionella israelensis]|uniref:Uncharacterized protein n=1 Tax=Legionella israelensis TaxID=454 RepID=A0AAX1EGK5_9GAMM|nr:hypothetical protein [Legionella israelensis]QBR84187.1 hypothetical protein E3983_07320 [Legionella israelensis]